MLSLVVLRVFVAVLWPAFCIFLQMLVQLGVDFGDSWVPGEGLGSLFGPFWVPWASLGRLGASSVDF